MSHPLERFRYCPVCGSNDFIANSEKSKKCQNCGFEYFMNPSSANVAFILNTYLYSNLNIPTLDLFYLCEVENCDELHAADDAEDCLWVPLKEIRVEEFGLQSLRRGIERFLSMNT